MQTKIALDDVTTVAVPVLRVAIELPAGFGALPVPAQQQEVENALARANDTVARILDRRREHVSLMTHPR